MNVVKKLLQYTPVYIIYKGIKKADEDQKTAIAAGIPLATLGCGGNGYPAIDHDGGMDGTDRTDSNGDVPPDTGAEAAPTDATGDALTCPARPGINDKYAEASFPTDIDIANGSILGLGAFSSNNLFVCNVKPNPMESTTCSDVFTIDQNSALPGGGLAENKPGKAVNLGDGRLVVTYDTAGPYPNGLIILDSNTYAPIQNIALGAIQFVSGQGTITVMPRPSATPLFLNDHLFIATQNYNVDTGEYERGTVVVFKKDSLTPTKFDLRNGVTLFFTNGRNPTAVAAKDNNNLAILNAHGPSGAVPFMLSPGKSLDATMDIADKTDQYNPVYLTNQIKALNPQREVIGPLTPRSPAPPPPPPPVPQPGPGEVVGASIDVVNVTNSANPVLTTYSIGDVELQKLPQLSLTQDKSKAIVGSATSPLTIYATDISGQPSAAPLTLPAASSDHLASIALTPEFAFVTTTGGNLYKINLQTMSIVGSSLYLCQTAGPSVIEGTTLYQACSNVCGQPGIISVDTTTMP